MQNPIVEKYEVGKKIVEKENKKQISFTVDGITVKYLVSYLQDMTEETIIYNEELSSKTVTMRVINQGIDDILDMVSRKLSVNLIRVRTMYYMGTATTKDRVTYITHLERYTEVKAKELISTMLSESGKVSITEDGNIVVVDLLNVIEQVKDVLSTINEQLQSVWLISIDVAIFQQNKDHAIGIDLNQVISEAIKYGSSNLAATLSMNINATLKAEHNIKYLETKNITSMVVQDGKQEKLLLGQKYPIQKTNITMGNSSTISTNDIAYQEIGLNIDVSIKQMSDKEKASVAVKYELSDIMGYDSMRNPIIQTYTQNVDLTVADGGRYIISSVTKNLRSRAIDKFINLSFSDMEQKMFYILSVKRIR